MQPHLIGTNLDRYFA